MVESAVQSPVPTAVFGRERKINQLRTGRPFTAGRRTTRTNASPHAVRLADDPGCDVADCLA
ncbi:hypothetical protein [Streptomyces collinus]|uniref:hypothetical protein n=1 Tax=Streptomyces collinus TaxID=42684 RepID=UPI00379C6286